MTLRFMPGRSGAAGVLTSGPFPRSWRLMEALRHQVPQKFLTVLATVAAAALAPVSPAHAQWSTPHRLARARVWSYLQLAVARSDSRSETVAWRREETLEGTLGGAEATTKGPEGSWHLAVLDSARREGPLQIALGSDADGRATLAWERFPSEHSMAPEVDVLTEPPAGGWSRPTRIVKADPEAGSLAMNVAPDGRAALVYHVGSHLSGIALRGTGGRWRRRGLALGALEGEPRVALLAGGGAAVAWEERFYPGRRESVKVMFLGPGGAPRGPVQTLARGDEKELDLELAGNLRGELVLAWRPHGAAGPLVAATRSPGGRFGAPARISPGGDSELSVAVDSEGDASVLFTHLLGGHEPVAESEQGVSPTSTQRTVVQNATKPGAAGPWASPVDVPAPAGMSTFSPQIVAAPTSDELLATWTVAPTRAVFGRAGIGGGWPPETSRDYTSTRLGVGEWSSPLTLASAGAGSATIALSDDGRATAAWVSSEPEPEAQYQFENVEVSELTP